MPIEISPFITFEYVLEVSCTKGKVMKKKFKYLAKLLVIEENYNILKDYSDEQMDDDTEAQLDDTDAIKMIDNTNDEDVVRMDDNIELIDFDDSADKDKDDSVDNDKDLDEQSDNLRDSWM